MKKLLKFKHLILILLFVFAAFAGCSEKITDASGQQTELKISVSNDVSLDLSQATTFMLTITGPGIDDPIKTSMILENGRLNCTVAVPAGPERRFIIEGFGEAGELIYSGQTVADIEPDVLTSIKIDLNPRVPMLKLSPVYFYGAFGSSPAFKIKAYNIEALNSIDINIINFPGYEEPVGANGSSWYADSVILNPAIADSNSLLFTALDDRTANIKISNLFGNSILDQSGCRDLATVYYRTYPNDGPPVYTFRPEINAMTGPEDNSINTEKIYLEDSAAELFYSLDRRVGYWRMDWSSNDGDSIVLDSSDNSLNGVARGTSWDEGEWGSARVFDGTGDYIEVPDNDLLNMDKGITCSFWIKIDAPNSIDKAVIFSKMSRSGSVNYQILISGLTSVGNCSLQFSYGESPNLKERQVYSAPVLGKIIGAGWQNVIFSYKFGDPSSAIFVSAYQRISGAWINGTGEILPPVSDGPLTFAMQLYPENPLYLMGSLDEFELYNAYFDYGAIRETFLPR